MPAAGTGAGEGDALAAWLARQQSIHARSIDLGLERVARVARALGVERPGRPVLTVAGTNGKGSTVALLDALLRAAGYRTGAFTSPHLVRYNERIRIGGAMASDAELVAAFERIERARGDTTLTFFEFNTLAALLVFAARGVEVLVLEVGLGGRLDATNVVDADVAVLCSVGWDHRDWLGDSLDAIGAEKAGIFRAGRPAVFGTPDMPQSVWRAARALGAPLVVAERDFGWTVGAERWSFRGTRVELHDLPPPALAGPVQLRNASTALAALEALGLPRVLEPASAAQALREVQLPGRFQIVSGEVEWILDVAHNEPAAAVLADALRHRPCRGRTLGVVGILGDKDAAAIGRMLQGLFDTVIACSLDEPRGEPAATLAARLGAFGAGARLAGSVAEGCALARELAQPGDRVVVFGSFHTVGPALEWLGLY